MFVFLQTSESFPDHDKLSNVTASGLAMTLDGFLKQIWQHPIWFHALAHIPFAYHLSSFFTIYCG